MVNRDEVEKLKAWMINTGLRLEGDLVEARNDFRTNENAWFAFRLALAAERKSAFDLFSAQLFALLNL